MPSLIVSSQSLCSSSFVLVGLSALPLRSSISKIRRVSFVLGVILHLISLSFICLFTCWCIVLNSDGNDDPFPKWSTLIKLCYFRFLFVESSQKSDPSECYLLHKSMLVISIQNFCISLGFFFVSLVVIFLFGDGCDDPFPIRSTLIKLCYFIFLSGELSQKSDPSELNVVFLPCLIFFFKLNEFFLWLCCCDGCDDPFPRWSTVIKLCYFRFLILRIKPGIWSIFMLISHLLMFVVIFLVFRTIIIVQCFCCKNY